MSDKIDELIVKFKGIKEELAKNVNQSYSGSQPNGQLEQSEKGVHVGSNPSEPGRSTMGVMTRIGAKNEAKAEAKRVAGEIKKMPKPKLVKSEELSFNDNGQWTLTDR